MKDKIDKQTDAKLYFMVEKKVGNNTKITFVACKNIPTVRGYAPTLEILQTHFKAERVRAKIAMQKDERYVPQPLYIEVDKNIFNDIVTEVQKKGNNDWQPEVMALTLGTMIPCCLIGKQKEK